MTPSGISKPATQEAFANPTNVSTDGGDAREDECIEARAHLDRLISLLVKFASTKGATELQERLESIDQLNAENQALNVTNDRNMCSIADRERLVAELRTKLATSMAEERRLHEVLKTEQEASRKRLLELQSNGEQLSKISKSKEALQARIRDLVEEKKSLTTNAKDVDETNRRLERSLTETTRSLEAKGVELEQARETVRGLRLFTADISTLLTQEAAT
ncbi:hypothetical protein HIM_10811 [Hirsutella minnesotensis 3608]|uniref:Uncharacterized protein n=1 Tax=Hirsutella minnesotensis 3608 TaxID=1043627 RepID=A0A0F7ZRK9_9HYPO|nr:hypothetical protein HIM_10811 [Hirsutella minnesotensis 3608]